MNTLKEKNIRDVFIFYRGVLYLTRSDLDGKNYYNDVLVNGFQSFLQETIDSLIALNIRVYLVSDNPTLPYTPRRYMTRPFGYGSAAKPLPITRQNVLEHQKEYLSMLDELHGAKIIKSIDTFCPKDSCFDFSSDGQVLYYDNNHLSVAGSLFQAEELLAPYLKQIASQTDTK